MASPLKAPPRPQSWNLEAGCLLLFGIPFLLGGVAALWLGWRGHAEPRLLIAGGALALTGGVMILGAQFSRRFSRRLADFQAQYPNQPWMWREDWAQGRCDYDGRRTVFAVWCLTAVWALVSWVAIESMHSSAPNALLLAALPLVGFGLAGWATRMTLRYRQFGVSRLWMSTHPGVIGGKLGGRIETRLSLPPPEGVRLTLCCLRQRRAGKGIREDLIWRAEWEIPSSRLTRGPEGFSIPFEVSIPAGLEQTSLGMDRVFWRLTARAAADAGRYKAEFEVPVFRVDGD